jgi:hypothetical protein
MQQDDFLGCLDVSIACIGTRRTVHFLGKDLMHYGHILPHIFILYNIISMFFDVFWDFLNNPLSFGYNSVWQKTPLFSVFDFPAATGLEKGQGQRPRFGIFETNKII